MYLSLRWYLLYCLSVTRQINLESLSKIKLISCNLFVGFFSPSMILVFAFSLLLQIQVSLNTIKFSTSPRVALWRLYFKKSNMFTTFISHILLMYIIIFLPLNQASHSILLATNNLWITTMVGPVLVRSAPLQWMKLCELPPCQDTHVSFSYLIQRRGDVLCYSPATEWQNNFLFTKGNSPMSWANAIHT